MYYAVPPNELRLLSAQYPVKRADHVFRAAVQDVRVNHCRADVAVAQKFLDCADVIAVLQHVRRKGMPKGVAAGVFVDMGFGHGFFHRLFR